MERLAKTSVIGTDREDADNNHSERYADHRSDHERFHLLLSF